MAAIVAKRLVAVCRPGQPGCVADAGSVEPPLAGESSAALAMAVDRHAVGHLLDAAARLDFRSVRRPRGTVRVLPVRMAPARLAAGPAVAGRTFPR
ncbi:hypothetical protein SN15_02910 [Stenotrophomonas maltophilia]|nr:hypothetical protein SN15_02910 [Stenotrophomonas maltophilia]